MFLMMCSQVRSSLKYQNLISSICVYDGYMKRAIAAFRKICKYDLSTTGDDVIREFDIDIADGDLDELADIISEGMLVQWMKPFTYRQESLESVLNTRDFTTYPPPNC